MIMQERLYKIVKEKSKTKYEWKKQKFIYTKIYL